MVVWELVSIGRGTTYLVSGKPRLTLPYDLGAQVMLQKWGATKVQMAPRNWSRLSVFSKFLAESGSVSNVLYVTVSCPGPATPHAMFPGQLICNFLIWTGNTHYMGFWANLLFSFSCSVVSNSLRPYGLQHTRFPCPSPSPGACSNSCPLSQWCHPTISSSAIPFSSCLQSIFPSIGVFSSESVLCIRWPQYWSFSFSISLSYEYSGLTSFRTDWFDYITSHEYKDVKHISTLCRWWTLCIFNRDVLIHLKIICLPTGPGQERIFGCQIMSVPLFMKNNQKDLGWMSRAITEKTRNTALCGWLLGPRLIQY